MGSFKSQHSRNCDLNILSIGPVGVSNSRPPSSQPGAQQSERLVRGTLKSVTIQYITIHHITAAVGRAHIAPTQMIAILYGPALPLLPFRRKVQSPAGLSTLYLSSVLCPGDGALGAPSGASGGTSEPCAYG